MSSKLETNKFVSLPVYAGVLFVAGVVSGISTYVLGCNAATSLACGAVVALIIPAIAAALCLMLLPVLIHELGHVVAGRLAGFSFIYMRVATFQVEKTSSGLKWSTLPWSNIGGLAGMLPVGNERLLQRMRIFTAGGIAASALLLATLLIVDARFGITVHAFLHFKDQPAKTFAFSFFTYFSAYIFLTSLLPISRKGIKNDGAKLLETFTNPKRSLVLVSQLRILSQLKQGIRAKEWDAADVEKIEQDWLGGLKCRPDILLYYYYLDMAEFSKAESLMDASVKFLRESNAEFELFAAQYYYEATFIYALQGRLEDAKRALAFGDIKGSLTNIARGRALTAILAREGNMEEATKIAGEALALLESEGDLSKPNWQAEADWLQWALEPKPLVE